MNIANYPAGGVGNTFKYLYPTTEKIHTQKDNHLARLTLAGRQRLPSCTRSVTPWRAPVALQEPSALSADLWSDPGAKNKRGRELRTPPPILALFGFLIKYYLWRAAEGG